MPARIDRQEVQRLLAAEQAQLDEVLPAADYEDEHPPTQSNRSRSFPPTPCCAAW